MTTITTNESSTTPEFRHLTISQVTPNFGGMIENFHLSELNEETEVELRQALYHYGVLFVRNQNLTPEQQKAVARVFADQLEEHTFGKTLADEGHPEVLVIEKIQEDNAKTTTDIWHHDVTGRKHPNSVSVLQAKEVPFGADTMWASATAAYDRLPYALKLLFLNIDIDHDTVYMALRHDYAFAHTALEKFLALGESNTHPAVINHPVTGKLCLMIGNGYTKRVNGYSAELSEMILKIANDLPKAPEIQVRYQWQPGDVAIWDNFATLHYGVGADLGDQRRVLHRVAAWSNKSVPSLDRETAIHELMVAQE